MKKRIKRNSSAYEDYKLSSPASAGTSLLHTLTYLASDKEWYNFAPNASFEVATAIASSVTLVGTGATFTQLITTTSIHGSAVSFLQASVPAQIDWIVQFGTSKNINVGQKWTASAYVKSNTVTSAGFSIIEYDGTTTVASTVDSQNLVAGAWTIMQATYTITTSAADILRIRFTKTGSSSCQFDNLQLVQNNERLPWVINTTMVGAAGTTQSTSAQSATYHTVGIDADDADFVQPYIVAKAGNTIWGYMQELSDATVAMYMGMTSCNTLKYRTPLKTSYADPTALFTVGLNTQDINTIVNADCANKVLIKGCLIRKDTTVRTIWNAAATGNFEMNGQLLNVLCTAGSYFPDTAEFPDYWAEYVSEKTTTERDPNFISIVGLLFRGQMPSHFRPARTTTTNSGEEIIGVISASIIIRTLSTGSSVQPLTLVTFDATTRPDAANILYHNSTGNNQRVSSCSIRGKLIRKSSGNGGFIHDSFVDYERIEKDGEQRVEIDSDMITSALQTQKVADYIWKRNRTPKHIYRTSEPGMLSYFEPGGWYTLRVGSVGKAEYIDSTVECYSVTQQRGIGTIGNTSIEFREVLENWKWDTNEYARFMAPGDPMAAPYTNVVTIGDQYCTQPVTFLCGATSCDTQINSAKDWLSKTYGGGTIQLLEGTYPIFDSIRLASNINLVGCGTNTIIRASSGIDIISIEGTAGGYVNNITVSNLKLYCPTAASATLLFGSYANDVIVNDCTFENRGTGVDYLIDQNTECKYWKVLNNSFVGNSSDEIQNGIKIGATYSVFANNIMYDLALDTLSGGKSGAMWLAADHNIITGNNIYNIINVEPAGETPGEVAGIMVYVGSYNTIQGNKITNVNASAASCYGIYIATASSSNMVINNYCYGNGDDAGLANSNGNNFHDHGTDTQLG